ncbi:hypothetical protein LY76DRAFT_649076 [Colletotrichum caudatum]|nr:hypothetical protein LY76DRAFT_649076 [Colletotrichum caudatum]
MNMETILSARKAYERKRAEKRKRRSEKDEIRRLEDIILEENKSEMQRVTTTSSRSSIRTRHRPETQHDDGQTAAAAFHNRPSAPLRNKTVRFAENNKLIRIPRAADDDDLDTAPPQDVTTTTIAAAAAAAARSTNEKAVSEHDESPPRNSHSYVDSLAIQAGAFVRSITWHKNETHNHYYSSQQLKSTPEHDSQDDSVPQGLASRVIRSSRFRWGLLYACLLAVAYVMLCRSVSWGYALLKGAVLFPRLLITLAGGLPRRTLAIFSSWTLATPPTTWPAEDTTVGSMYQAATADAAVAPLVPHLARLAGVTGQADLVSREVAGLLLLIPGGGGTPGAVPQISAALEHLQTVQDETNEAWERKLREHLRATRRLTANLRRLQHEAEQRAASSWWRILCDLPPPALVPKTCLGLQRRVGDLLDKASELAQTAKRVRETHIEGDGILSTAYDVKESLCRLHEQDVLGGIAEQVSKQISALADGDVHHYHVQREGDGDGDGVAAHAEEKKADEGVVKAEMVTTEVLLLRQVGTRIGDQRSGLRVNCMAAAQTEVGVGRVRGNLMAQVEALEEVSDSLLWLRQSLGDQEKSASDAITAGLELLSALGEQLMKCV